MYSVESGLTVEAFTKNKRKTIQGTYDGFLYCVDLKIGRIFWKFKTDDIVKCTAVLCSKNRNVLFGSYDRKAYCVSLEVKMIKSISPKLDLHRGIKKF